MVHAELNFFQRDHIFLDFHRLYHFLPLHADATEGLLIRSATITTLPIVSTMTAIGSNLVFPWELVARCGSLPPVPPATRRRRAIDESIAWFPTLLARSSAAVERAEDRLNVQGKGTVLLLLLRLLTRKAVVAPWLRRTGSILRVAHSSQLLVVEYSWRFR
jgi:hypothetical protein